MDLNSGILNLECSYLFDGDFFLHYTGLSQRETKLKFGSRFLSLHKRRRRPRPTMKLAAECIALLDAHYNGQAQVSVYLGFTLKIDTMTGERQSQRVPKMVWEKGPFPTRGNLGIIDIKSCNLGDYEYNIA